MKAVKARQKKHKAHKRKKKLLGGKQRILVERFKDKDDGRRAKIKMDKSFGVKITF